jgi:hypothetical protein
VQAAGVDGAVVGADGEDDLPAAAEGLQVVQLAIAAPPSSQVAISIARQDRIPLA